MLLVDGDADFRERLAKELADEIDWITVTEAPTAAAALEWLKANESECVVSAYELPDMDGLAFLRMVRQSDPHLPFILFPADGSEELASDAIAHGVSEYLPRDGYDDQFEALASRIAAQTSPPPDGIGSAPIRDWFEKLVRNSSDIVFVVDTAGDYQYLSPAVEEVLGYDPETLVGVNGFELVHPDDLEDTQAEFFRGIEDPDYQPEVEFRAKDQDGSWRWLAVRGQNLLDDPVIGGFVVNARDVTEGKRYERQAAEREDRLRRIAEHLPATVIWMTDQSFSEVIYISPGYEDIWGRPADELYENPTAYLDGVHPDDRARVLQSMADLNAELDTAEVPEAEQIEYRVVRPDGNVRWVRGTTVPIRDEDTEFNQWIGLATDITARKERERELESYETLHRTVPDGLLIIDEEGTMQLVNNAWATLLGKESEELEGQPFEGLVEEGLVDESVTEQYSDLLRELLSSAADCDRGTLIIRTTFPGQSREHVYEAHVGLLPYDETFRGSAVVVRDVTTLQRRYDG